MQMGSSKKVTENSRQDAANEYGVITKREASEVNSRKSGRSDVYHEFAAHFKKNDRSKTPMTHHDFLLSKSHKNYNVAQLISHDRHGAAENNLIRDRLKRAHHNYLVMSQNSVEVPLSKNVQKQNDAYALKARQRQLQKEEDKQKSLMLSFMSSPSNAVKKTKSVKPARNQQIEQDLKNREYPYRYLFVLADNQDLFSPSSLQLIKVEINHRLCRIIP